MQETRQYRFTSKYMNINLYSIIQRRILKPDRETRMIEVQCEVTSRILKRL